MKVPCSWLKEYLDRIPPADELSKLISLHSFPVDSIEKIDGDEVLMVDVPYNRSDCFSIIGVAREISAITSAKLKLPSVCLSESSNVNDYVKVLVEDRALCPRYVARVIYDVNVKPSPDWMQKKLTLAGVRPVNNVVDVTNYVMFETGHPLHAFDIRFLQGAAIVVRRAQQGEKIKAINDENYTLTQDMLVIADAKYPVALAGIIGGQGSEIRNDTRIVILESALFDHISIMKTSKKLGVKTESSSRFERKCDFDNVEFSSQRAASMISELCGGKIAGGSIDLATNKPEKISLKLRDIKRHLGIAVKDADGILAKLGFAKSGDTFIVPSWRKDVTQDIDLVEEVARINGYDKIPCDEGLNVQVVTVPMEDRVRNIARRTLTSLGFQEAYTLSLIEKGGRIPLVPFGMLRDSIAPLLFSVLNTNQGYKQEPRPVFDVAKVYLSSAEKEVLAMAHPAKYVDLKGAVESLLTELQLDFSIERNSVVVSGDKTGEISMDGEYPYCELDFQVLVEKSVLDKKFKDFSRLPFVKRDLAIIVDENTEWVSVEKCVKDAQPEFLEQITLFDVYTGKQIPEAKKSFAFSLFFRTDRTLKSSEVDLQMNKVIGHLTDNLNATLRS